MSFNNISFVIVLLPVFIILYYLFGKSSKYTNALLLITSLIFYSFGNLYSFMLISISIVFNYFYLKIKTFRNNRLLFYIFIGLNILYLCFFKGVFSQCLPCFKILPPLAISYYTLSQISFGVDYYNLKIEKYNFIDYSIYVLYFPKILQGPFVNYNFFINQLHDENSRIVNWSNMWEGLLYFSFGLFKKVVIADIFTSAVNYGFANINVLSNFDTIILSLSFYIQLYFDFSGYSDMAYGISKMINIELPINFNSPYKSNNISDFWNRWHISFEMYLKEYIYIPLKGNRCSKLRQYFNIMMVFVISGLWHGFNDTYIIWGLLNGLLVIGYKKISNYYDKLHLLLKRTINTIVINLLWIIFRANTIKDSIQLFKKMFSIKNVSYSSEFMSRFNINEIKMLRNFIPRFRRLSLSYFVIVAILSFLVIIFFFPNTHEFIKKNKTKKHVVSCIIVLVWAILSMTSSSVFIYEGF